MNTPPKLLGAFNRVAPKGVHGKVMPFLTDLNTKYFKRPEMDADLRLALRQSSASDVERLARRIERDLTAWLPTGDEAGNRGLEDVSEPASHGVG
jgi:hypothetical protein